MTALKLRHLQAIREICMKQPIGFATPAEVEAAMGLNPRVAKVMLKRLLDMGLLERPYRGCYRLTDEGRKIMKEADKK
jgi:Mn-dependent DtxR family transcriptional regulator